MGNVRSLPNKMMDELAALTRHQREYRECSLLLFTETWLTALTPDTAAELDGLHTPTGGQKQGERMRPYYLPREFTHALVVVVYVPPSANADAACDVLLSAVSRLQTQHPDALLLISGDFNHASPSSSLPKFTQRRGEAFVSGNKEELKSVQRELRRMIRKGKNSYRRKMEHQLQQNNICGVWKGLKTISGFKEPKSQPVGDQGWANDLNLFFNRFDQASAPPPAQSSSAATPITVFAPCPLLPPVPLPLSTTLPVHTYHSPLSRPSVHTYPPPSQNPSHLPSVHTYPQFTPTTGHCHFTLCPVHLPPINTSLLQPAPHNTPDQLCGIFGYTFNLSLKLGRVPQLWKKRPASSQCQRHLHPKELNSYRPVALTSHLMKTLERLVLVPSAPAGELLHGPTAVCAYQPDIGVDDAVIYYLLHTSLTHLEKPGSTVRIMFFDFSSAFNNHPAQAAGDKLQLAGVDHHLTTWILDYLTHTDHSL
ncbi:hypothetical protein L3Q82_009973 [Scortum barcoo]|uniref:Uncharacterized protein n=1 Tax=Scortum barcoo TaxID=214431 RepID=A0ACB8WEG1_9TELE|nr:hypothetical protein L3Q82_009973 [Scortum barcoo]